MNTTEKKIELLIEDAAAHPRIAEFLRNNKGIALAGLGGMVGAGLNAYLDGETDPEAYVNPLLAWGLGGAIGGASPLFKTPQKIIDKTGKQFG